MDLILDQIPAGASILIDTNPIIYFLKNSNSASRYQPLFEAVQQGRNELVVTPITLAEVLGGPARTGNEVLLERYEQALTGGAGWRFVALDAGIAVHAARLRARYRLKLPDAIQLATALAAGCFAVVTHDRDFSAVTEIPIIA
ncbi:MAG: PIN domain-containing protein [Planctomycetes bacterium]|nr:PIN domain-containing protein [Planctomycetota bacterium]